MFFEYIPRQVTITVGTSSVEVATQVSRGNRSSLVLTNTSNGGQVISVGVGQEAVAGSGIVLPPGAVLSEYIDPSFKPTTARITAVSSAAGGTLAVYERVQP